MALVGYVTPCGVLQSWSAFGVRLTMFITAFAIMAIPAILLGLAVSTVATIVGKLVSK